jgi:hypothetical protein
MLQCCNVDRCAVTVGHETLEHSMRTLIAILVVLSLSIVGLPRLEPVAQAAVAARAGSVHARQGRAKAKKKKAPRPAKAKKVEKKTDKSKKNDRGFEL